MKNPDYTHHAAVSFNAAASGLATNEDPWDGNTVFPLMEGAAIVSIDKGARFVTVFDDVSGLLLFPGSSPLNYVLQLITPTLAGDDLKFNTIAADGQVGNASVAADQAVTTETTTITNIGGGLQLAGPGSLSAETDNDSDFNGNSARPLPMLWDVSTQEFTDPNGGTSELHVQYTSAADCSNIVANVFSQLQHF